MSNQEKLNIQKLNSINRRILIKYVSKKMKHKILKIHIASVINILLDELISELFFSNSIKVGNFGMFFLKKMSPRKYFDVLKKRVTISFGNKVLRFKLNKKIQKYIINSLDIAETFKENDNG